MKKNVAVIVLGILFGISLGVVSYLYLALSIAFGLAGIDIMTYAWWIFAGLALVTVIFSCFAKKLIVLPRVALTVSVVFSAITHIFSLVQFVSMDAVQTDNIALFIALFASLVIGFVAMVLSYKAKNPANVEQSVRQPVQQ